MQDPDKKKKTQSIDREWEFKEGTFDLLSQMQGSAGRIVNLPHDYMIEQDVEENAPAGPAMGYYNGKTAHYTKKLVIPSEWKSEEVLLHFDGVMMNATVDINGNRVALQHYGYTPFEADITHCIYWDAENRITVTCNPGMQPNSRWYTGAGIYRHVSIIHRPLLHIADHGIYAYTDSLDENAYVKTKVTVENHTREDRLIEVEVTVSPETFKGRETVRKTTAFVKGNGETTVCVPVTITDPVLWDDAHPELYKITAVIKEQGEFAISPVRKEADFMTDSDSTLFGIRTVKANSKKGLLINGKRVKLKGGCIHHDHGILGAVSFYDSEYRKLTKMKNLGYNAVRMAHNPPSEELLEVCDRIGMYVMDEAFDCWGMGKQPGDYSLYFATDWQKDVEAFMKRDRNHPSVILWSTGNEIVERGGLGNGYALSTELAEYMRTIDATRLITNGVCSYWSGLDDAAFADWAKTFFATGNVTQLQNASGDCADTSWEERSEPFVNALDVIGYNYLEDHYVLDGKLYPERVIVGTESYPLHMKEVWELVETLPYVIGDFTWTAMDYIGEAGIGKSIHGEKDDPAIQAGPYSLMSHSSRFPWRLGNDADIDLIGDVLPQGEMRKLIWGGTDTGIFTVPPQYYGQEELISMWGWSDIVESWSWKGWEGKPIEVIVYSPGDEVALFLNGKFLQSTGVHNHIAKFDIIYSPGTIRACSKKDGKEISEKSLVTSMSAKEIRLNPEKNAIPADGNSLCFVGVEILDAQEEVVKDEDIQLTAKVSGPGELQGFGSSAPITDENYTKGIFTTYRGKALAVIRSGYEAGDVTLTVSGNGMSREIRIAITDTE